MRRVSLAAQFLNCSGLELMERGDTELIIRASYYQQAEIEAIEIERKIRAERK